MHIRQKEGYPLIVTLWGVALVLVMTGLAHRLSEGSDAPSMESCCGSPASIQLSVGPPAFTVASTPFAPTQIAQRQRPSA